MSSNDIQLEMNFSEKQNRFRKTVEQGEFSLLIESAVPAKQLSTKEAVAELRALEESVLAIDEIKTGLAIELPRSQYHPARKDPHPPHRQSRTWASWHLHAVS